MFSVINTVLLIVILVRLYKGGSVIVVRNQNYYTPDKRGGK